MAEQHVFNTKYKYDLNASLVQSQSRSNQASNVNQSESKPVGDGSGETLAGRNLPSFGDRVQRTAPTELKEKAEKKLKEGKTGKDKHSKK